VSTAWTREISGLRGGDNRTVQIRARLKMSVNECNVSYSVEDRHRREIRNSSLQNEVVSVHYGPDP